MHMLNAPQLSTRAASWSAAQCVRHFCVVRGILDPDLDAFCEFLEDAATASSIVEWDARSSELAVSGLGDSLPATLESVQGLNELLCCAREVTASEMYAAWTPGEVMKNLREAAERAGLDATL
jgi:hypothetical protein